MASAKKRGAYHHGDLRRALVEGSIALIAEEGVEALTLRSLARRLGVSHAAPHHHFASKDELLVAVADAGYAALGQALERAAARHTDPFDRLAATGVAYVSFAADHPAQFRLMFGAQSRHTPPPDDANRVLVSAARAVALALGDERLVKTIILAAWSIVHGLATLWLDGPVTMEKRELRKRAREMTTLVMTALRAVKPEAPTSRRAP